MILAFDDGWGEGVRYGLKLKQKLVWNLRVETAGRDGLCWESQVVGGAIMYQMRKGPQWTVLDPETHTGGFWKGATRMTGSMPDEGPENMLGWCRKVATTMISSAIDENSFISVQAAFSQNYISSPKNLKVLNEFDFLMRYQSF